MRAKQVRGRELGYPCGVGDPITIAEQERANLLELLEQADDQAAAWHEERNRLIIQASALNISARRISQYVSLSDRGVGLLIKRERARAGVESGQTKT